MKPANPKPQTFCKYRRPGLNGNPNCDNRHNMAFTPKKRKGNNLCHKRCLFEAEDCPFLKEGKNHA